MSFRNSKRIFYNNVSLRGLPKGGVNKELQSQYFMVVLRCCYGRAIPHNSAKVVLVRLGPLRVKVLYP